MLSNNQYVIQLSIQNELFCYYSTRETGNPIRNFMLANAMAWFDVHTSIWELLKKIRCCIAGFWWWPLRVRWRRWALIASNHWTKLCSNSKLYCTKTRPLCTRYYTIKVQCQSFWFERFLWILYILRVINIRYTCYKWYSKYVNVGQNILVTTNFIK